MFTSTISPSERFWSKVLKSDNPADCWEWQGTLLPTGYGQIKVNGRMIRAHRFTFELTNGYIPKDLFVCRSCDNRKCCNPSHLWLGTAADNSRDMVSKGRSVTGKHYGSDISSAKINASDAVEIINLSDSGVSKSELSRRYGLSRRQIARIINGESWYNITGQPLLGGEYGPQKRATRLLHHRG